MGKQKGGKCHSIFITGLCLLGKVRKTGSTWQDVGSTRGGLTE